MMENDISKRKKRPGRVYECVNCLDHPLPSLLPDSTHDLTPADTTATMPGQTSSYTNELSYGGTNGGW